MLPSTALWFLAVFLITRVHAQSNSSTLPVGSCTPTIPCSNGACCNGDSGFCGFGQAFCKQVSEGGPCTSNCDALAECGPNAAPTNFTCPLNVCCSQVRVCSFGPPGPASCGPEQQSALHRQIGYYEGWAASRSCSYTPEMISADTLTHINFAFALISDSFTITEMSPGDAALWARTTALKKNNVALKVFLSIGGWSFNDPPTSQIFSQLVGSDPNTATFIASALNTLQAYGFDGIDVDWEYPAAFDRGGSPADKANYVTFMSKVKAAFGPRNYGLTFTAPSSYWYLQHFDLPGLMQYADWVNVMTYDLHGLIHINLVRRTEIQDTLSLFNNVGIDPSKIVLGIGFYGRSFQLADSGCTSPGCAFVGGADPGPCSANSGTLMFSEIETIIAQNGLNPIFDEAAAVKYIVWNDDQWVSYDDAQTLQMKVQFANSRCLGGTMIWSVDQDDMHYTALSSLYPGIDVNNPSAVESGDQCAITGCGQSCPDGWDTLTTLTTNPGSATSCDTNSPAKLCCPSGNAPQNCHWTGGGGSTCNPACGVGELTLATDPVGGDGNPTCVQGTKAFCCQTGQNDPTGCHATACGESSSTCASTDSFLTFVRQALNSDPIIINNEPCPTICSTNNKPVCCESSVISAYSNVATGSEICPNCLNAACPTGQVGIFSDIQGDASQSCIGDGRRLYCCNPPNNEQFLPVPESWVLPSLDPTPGRHGVLQPATFTVDFDDFGEVFISSPNPGSVSSLDIASDWVIHGCDRSSDQPQEVLAYCFEILDGDDSGCGHVFITQAEHTIVRMPTTCAVADHTARVVSLVPHDDQDALPSHLRRALPENELVYSLKFDYNFAAMINTAPDEGTTSTKRSNRKRDYHQPEETGEALKLNTVKNGNSISRNFHWSDHGISNEFCRLIRSKSCPNFSTNSRFGYYLEATIVPPAIQQCYVYLSAGASAQATFTITGLARLISETERAEIISFGLLTLGRVFICMRVNGMSGSYKTSVGYEISLTHVLCQSIDLTFGKEDRNNDVEEISNGVDPNFQQQRVPSLQLGISVLGGSVLDAQVFAEADIYAGVSITGSYFGVDLNAGISILIFESARATNILFPFGGGCFSSADQASGSGNSRRERHPKMDRASHSSDRDLEARGPLPAREPLLPRRRHQHLLKPEIESDFDNTTSTGPLHVFASRASGREAGMWRCKDLDVPIPSYYDLANPASLDPTVVDHIPVPENLGRMPNGERYLSVPKGHGNTIIYAREHPYEASMASVFIDYLILQTDLWQNANNDAKFCPWVTENLKNAPTAYSPAGFGGKSLRSFLPLRIHQLNQYSFKPSPFRSDKNFKTYCPKKQIAVMRSAAGIFFLNMNTCVRDVWLQWATAYQNSNVVANVPTFVRIQCKHLISLYNKAQTTAATVDLSFPVLLDTCSRYKFTRNGGPVQNVQIDPNSYASGLAVTQADLTAQIFNQIQDINWINSLPFH
ncbi:chitin-binding type-1 domain-containing protein [Favolaschia claudopus]|uniref:Chitin-binding type-1 domain-containing protein n=1 Tax=Favolaschia claudopus TaxID=2862362 RepID=A0AAW0DWY4_9AGAR